MSEQTLILLAKLGVGATLSWLALPLFTFAARRGMRPMPDAREKTLLFALAVAAVLVVMPFLPAQQLPAAMGSLAPPLVGEHGLARPMPEQAWPAFAVVGALFALAVAGRGLHQLIRYLQLQRQLDHAAAPPERVAKIRDLLCRDLGIEAPTIIVSQSAALPFVTGALEQRVVLPAELVRELSDEQLTLVLRHELIHVSRRDGFTALLAELFALPFPFHPAASRALADIIVARESAVDLRASAPDPHGYATLLVHVAERHQYGPAVASAVAMGKHALGKRLTVLMERTPRGRDGTSRLLLLGATLMLGFAAVLVPRVTQAAVGYSDGSRIKIKIGEEKVMTLGPVSRIAIGDPEICDVKIDAGFTLVLIGRSKGKTTFLVWRKDGERISYLIDVE